MRTYGLTESMINDEPRFRYLEIIHDSLCIIETQQNKNIKETLYKNEARQTYNLENTQNYVTHNIEFEREITKRLEIEKNFELELQILELGRFEIKHCVRQHKKNL